MTERTGHMGYTFRFCSAGGVDAVARKSKSRNASASWKQRLRSCRRGFCPIAGIHGAEICLGLNVTRKTGYRTDRHSGERRFRR